MKHRDGRLERCNRLWVTCAYWMAAVCVIAFSQQTYDDYVREIETLWDDDAQRRRFEEFQREQTAAFQQFQEQEQAAYRRYVEEIEQKWNEFLQPSKAEWVEYDDDKDTRSKVNF